MFTGIISDVGEVIERTGGQFKIRSAYDPASIAIGASIACSGVCLTVTAVEPKGAGSIFSVDVSNETLSKTTLESWRNGQAVNLERALRAGELADDERMVRHVAQHGLQGVACALGEPREPQCHRALEARLLRRGERRRGARGDRARRHRVEHARQHGFRERRAGHATRDGHLRRGDRHQHRQHEQCEHGAVAVHGWLRLSASR